MTNYISLLPFIDFLRKSGLEISIDESIQAQKVLNLGKFNTSEIKLRQSLKSILVRRRTEFDIFDSCFDIFFLKFKNRNLSSDLIQSFDDTQYFDNQSANGMQMTGEVIESSLMPGMRTEGSGQNQVMGQLDDLEEYKLLSDVIQYYYRWLPDSLQEYANDFLLQPESMWQDPINTFIEYIFGFGQYKHTQTIAERFNRFSRSFTRAYTKLLDDIKENENISFQVKYLEQLEYLKLKIETFLRNVRINLLQSEYIDSTDLIRYLYASSYIPNIKNFLTEEFNRIEGDFDKVQQYLLYLGKKIAIQERKKRIKAQRGKINFRRTIRKNISVGGTLLNISYHKKKRKDPKIILLADVSGSTEWVSEFFFVITYAAQSTFKKLSLFEFDNTTVEITKGLKSPTLSQALLRRIQSWESPPRPRAGHSNYQTSFDDFLTIGEKYISKDTNILILGDCRDWLGGYKQNSKTGDYEPESKTYLERITKRVKRVIILNPESPSQWNTGDSIVSHFEDIGVKVYHVQNILSMIDFIFKTNWYN